MNNTKIDKIGTLPNHDIYAVFINSELSYVLSFPKIKKEFIKLNIFLQSKLTNQDIFNIYEKVDYLELLTIVPVIKEDFLNKEQYIKIGNKLANIINHVYTICVQKGIPKEKIKSIFNVMNEQNQNIEFISWFQEQLKGHLECKTIEEIQEEEKLVSEINSSSFSDDDDLFNTLPRLQKIKEHQEEMPSVTKENKKIVEKEKTVKETLSNSSNLEQGKTNYNLLCILVILGLTVMFVLRSFLLK